MIEMVRIYSKGFLENVTIEELTPSSMLTREQFQKLSDEVGETRSLLVMCGAFRVKNLDDFPNLTVKKIPKAVMSRCEWGKDDYSLEIKNLQVREMEPVEDQSELPSARGKTDHNPKQAIFFDLTEGKGGKRND
ncbi:MAG: hypothetical protein A2156_10620 [Deltaproteobacteria bacterium RBG_16_48_10]|nr:MAG: hypothetical protein A2156_10620 [Deltaproteobacteria bacterium RBG_16_48_10]